MIYYALELVNVKNEKPEVMEALIKGAFSINRSGNAFAGVAVGVAGVADMASEQNINAHAKNCLKGIMTYADIDSAVNRWHVTSPMRSEISNALLKYADMKSNEGGNKEVKEQRKKKDKDDLEKLKKLITSTINPFQQRRHKEYLFNMKTGKQVTKVAEKYLLNVMKEGKRQRDAFIPECQEDTNRFEKPIRMVKVNNFTTANFITRNKSKQAQKPAEAKGTRDIFGRLLFFLSFQQKIDVSMVFQYSLVPDPPCFTHPDGAL